MEHDTIAFVEKNHAAILGTLAFCVAWFKNELKTVAPIIWKFLGDYSGYQGVWLYIKTGQKQKKETKENETQNTQPRIG